MPSLFRCFREKYDPRFRRERLSFVPAYAIPKPSAEKKNAIHHPAELRSRLFSDKSGVDGR
jgi:hypothetical protein